jgi:hypothetical protein
MKPRFLGAIGFVATIILAVILWPFLQADLTQRQQQRLLIRSLAAPSQSTSDFNEIKKWEGLGATNAAAVLTRALETKPGTYDKAYSWFWARTSAAIQSKLPRPLDAATADAIRNRALNHLIFLPKAAARVSPSTWARALRDPFWGIRMNTLACLSGILRANANPGALGQERRKILSLVLEAAQDPRVDVRMNAVQCLGYFREAPDEIIPVLSKAITNQSPDIRIQAAIAFHRLNPLEAEQAGAFSAAVECLHSDGPFGSKSLAFAWLKEQGKLPANETK